MLMQIALHPKITIKSNPDQAISGRWKVDERHFIYCNIHCQWGGAECGSELTTDLKWLKNSSIFPVGIVCLRPCQMCHPKTTIFDWVQVAYFKQHSHTVCTLNFPYFPLTSRLRWKLTREGRKVMMASLLQLVFKLLTLNCFYVLEEIN